MTLPEKLRARAKELSHGSRIAGGDWTATLLEMAAESLDASHAAFLEDHTCSKCGSMFEDFHVRLLCEVCV